jgi:hypothetical protein
MNTALVSRRSSGQYRDLLATSHEVSSSGEGSLVVRLSRTSTAGPLAGFVVEGRCYDGEEAMPRRQVSVGIGNRGLARWRCSEDGANG